ncbi:hypothetical protein QCO44_09325 [Selenomonas sputigena]|uniref:Uncharacterized protein n=1 Tax=Selenomonas sputigena TaxID=69823 RepID=A0ABV3X6K1_9FIRM
MTKNIYAAYRGDEYIGEGTVEEIAAMAGVSYATARWGTSPTARRRDAAKRKNRSKGMLILELVGTKGDDI